MHVSSIQDKRRSGCLLGIGGSYLGLFNLNWYNNTQTQTLTACNDSNIESHIRPSAKTGRVLANPGYIFLVCSTLDISTTSLHLNTQIFDEIFHQENIVSKGVPKTVALSIAIS